jgi:hypothetical protein
MEIAGVCEHDQGKQMSSYAAGCVCDLDHFGMFGLSVTVQTFHTCPPAAATIGHADMLAPKRLWSDILESLEQTETGGVQRWDVLSAW